MSATASPVDRRRTPASDTDRSDVSRRRRHAAARRGRGPEPVRPRDPAPGARRRVQEARPAGPGQEPGHVRRARRHGRDASSSRSPTRGSSTGRITIWLFLTVVFANFAEAMAEGRGKAQADTLRRMRSETEARRLRPDGTEERVAAAELAKGDLVVCEAGDVIPSDGEIVEGIASVDESAITGESAPVIRESGGDRSAVTGGTKVLSDRIVVRITAETGPDVPRPDDHPRRGGEPPEDPERDRADDPAGRAHDHLPAGRASCCSRSATTPGPRSRSSSWSSLLVCLIPTTIGALLSAIGIAGMDRLVQRNVLAMSGRAVEAAGDVQTLLLDKTGTITLGNRMASAFFPVGGHTEQEVADAAQLASLADETPEGRSIVVLAKERFGIRERELGRRAHLHPLLGDDPDVGPRRRRPAGPQGRRGGGEALGRPSRAGRSPAELDPIVDRIARAGSTPLVVADGPEVLGVIELKDVVKRGHRGAVRRDARHGHPHGDDHRRQPADGRGDRPGGRRRRLPGRGDAGDQDGADQVRSRRAASSSP